MSGRVGERTKRPNTGLEPARHPAHRARQIPEAKSMKLRIVVTLKNGVLDPQGKAIEHALGSLGFSGVGEVRVGKLIELDVADGTSDADIDAMCQKLLANTVIENYRVEKQ
jgi:phosphoribosylformylglycinamidine synthase subunit PurS